MAVFGFNDSYKSKIQRIFWMRNFVLNFMKVNSNLLIIFVLRIISIVAPPTKLREGNVFRHVCLFTGRMLCDYRPVETSSLEDPPLAFLPTWDLFKRVHFGPPWTWSWLPGPAQTVRLGLPWSQPPFPNLLKLGKAGGCLRLKSLLV